MSSNNMSRQSRKMFEVVIRESSRAYGYIFWKQTQDEEAKVFFGDLTRVSIWIEGAYVGEKPIDWDSRRIFVGLKHLRNVPKEASVFRLEFSGSTEIRVTSF